MCQVMKILCGDNCSILSKCVSIAIISANKLFCLESVLSGQFQYSTDHHLECWRIQLEMFSHVLWITYCLLLGLLCGTHMFKNRVLRVVSLCVNPNEMPHNRKIISEHMWIDRWINSLLETVNS